MFLGSERPLSSLSFFVYVFHNIYIYIHKFLCLERLCTRVRVRVFCNEGPLVVDKIDKVPPICSFVDQQGNWIHAVK